jgi:multimeric flavodoxin WrbA
MPHILGVVGSPRKGGNTYVLVEALLEGAREAGAETRLLHLRGLDIRECEGCHGCWKNGECIKRDDMREVFPVIASTDAIVFGTPVYWYGPTALMKAFLDRFVYFNTPAHRALVRGKAAALVVPFEDTSPETAQPLRAMLQKSFEYLELELVAELLVPGVTERGEVRDHADPMQAARQIGEQLARRQRS